ncbi:hypothetical protein BH10ACI3_BH10ACI3_05820 [soil metagenome]
MADMFERFKHRSYELERLDTGDFTDHEYRRWQNEMHWIHGIFGETRALKRTLFREIDANGKSTVSVLDVGAGSGLLLRKLGKWLGSRRPFLVGADLSKAAARSIADDKLTAVQCDATRLPFADRSFDHVFCSLFLHHLGDDDAVSFVREMARVSSGRIYVIDLNRHPTAYYLYKTVGRLFFQRFTVEDGALSILRSHTPEELRAIGEKAGLADIKVVHSRVNRLVLSGVFHKAASK